MFEEIFFQFEININFFKRDDLYFILEELWKDDEYIGKCGENQKKFLSYVVFINKKILVNDRVCEYKDIGEIVYVNIYLVFLRKRFYNCNLFGKNLEFIVILYNRNNVIENFDKIIGDGDIFIYMNFYIEVMVCECNQCRKFLYYK